MTQSGRITRINHERGGYRVWLSGGRFPFFFPEIRFRNFPWRVGLSVRFGGYYDPLGYVNVYDVGGYPGYAPIYTSGVLHGVIESVDFRRGTLVLNDDISGRFVTVTLRDDYRFDDLRPGDQVEFSGDWTRSGFFEARRLEYVDNRYDRNRGDDGRRYDDEDYRGN